MQIVREAERPAAAAFEAISRTDTDLVRQRGPAAAIFLHSGWRSCGTWLWEALRECRTVRAYYEPLHEDLDSLDRAALIDGCSRLKMLWKILLPVARPGIVATAIFCFLASWNEFLFALILTSTPKSQTIPVILAGFLSQAQFYTYGPMFAATVLSIAPPVAVAFLFQRFLVQGALSGAVKG